MEITGGEEMVNAVMFNPTTIAKLQQAVRLNSQESYNVYSKAINEQAKNLMTIRGLFEFDNLDPIPLEEVNLGQRL